MTDAILIILNALCYLRDDKRAGSQSTKLEAGK